MPRVCINQFIGHLQEFTYVIYVQPRFSSVEKLRLFKIQKNVKGKRRMPWGMWISGLGLRVRKHWSNTYGGQTIRWQYGNVPNPEIPTIVMSTSGHSKMRFWNLSGRWWFSPHSNERYTRWYIMCHRTGWRLRRGNGGFDEYGSRWGWNTLDRTNQKTLYLSCRFVYKSMETHYVIFLFCIWKYVFVSNPVRTVCIYLCIRLCMCICLRECMYVCNCYVYVPLMYLLTW